MVMNRVLPVSLILLVVFISGCSWRKDRLNVDVSGVKIPHVKIYRYDQDLFKVSTDNLEAGLQKIQNNYLFFLGTDLKDPVKLGEMRAYLTNQRNIDFQKEVSLRYKDLSGIENDFTTLFRHYKYYYPEQRLPRVYTYISGGDYENPVQMADSVLLIALDTYLGKDFKPYFADGLPVYKAERMTRVHIVPDAAREMINSMYPPDPATMTLLDRIVESGKQVYLVQALLPETQLNVILNYSSAKYEWLKKNESHIWAAIIENRMLFSGSGDLLRLFLGDGPCTPDFTTDSPPRIGEWIGFQIVKHYMDSNPDISIPELMKEKDAQRIFSHSGYKPEK
jgi:hypothetical protein